MAGRGVIETVTTQKHARIPAKKQEYSSVEKQVATLTQKATLCQELAATQSHKADQLMRQALALVAKPKAQEHASALKQKANKLYTLATAQTHKADQLMQEACALSNKLASSGRAAQKKVQPKKQTSSGQSAQKKVRSKQCTPKRKEPLPAKVHFPLPSITLIDRCDPLPLAPVKEQPLTLPQGKHMHSKMSVMEAIRSAHDLGYTTLQLFLSDPDSMQMPSLSASDLLSMKQVLSEASLSPLVIHAPFVIDLASTHESRWVSSVLHLRTILLYAQLIGASDVVVHLNNYKKSFERISEKHLERLIKGITLSLSDGPGRVNTSIRLLLENGCHPHFSPGSIIEELGLIVQVLPPAYQSQVAVCLDTAHCWSAGYDLCHQMDQFLWTVEQSIGLARVRLIHLNDARYELGSFHDEHAQWGTGQISAHGVHGIRSLLQDPRLAHVALIMETPLGKDEAGHFNWEQEKEHVAWVKQRLLAP